jgi:hypothetical protein
VVRHGLLSVHGKAAADQLKIENQKSHPAIFAEMLGLSMGKPELHLDGGAERFAAAFRTRHKLVAGVPVVGLNTGAGGRWRSKALTVERTAELAERLHQALETRVAFLLLAAATKPTATRRSSPPGRGA